MAGQPWVPGVWGLMSASWPASGLPDFVVPRATPLVSAHSPGLRNPGPAFPDPAAVVPSLLLTACGGPAPAWLVFSWWHGPQGPVRYANSLISLGLDHVRTLTRAHLALGLLFPQACAALATVPWSHLEVVTRTWASVTGLFSPNVLHSPALSLPQCLLAWPSTPPPPPQPLLPLSAPPAAGPTGEWGTCSLTCGCLCPCSCPRPNPQF